MRTFQSFCASLTARSLIYFRYSNRIAKKEEGKNEIRDANEVVEVLGLARLRDFSRSKPRSICIDLLSCVANVGFCNVRVTEYLSTTGARTQAHGYEFPGR